MRITKNQKIKEIYSNWDRENPRVSFIPKLVCCGVEIKFRESSKPREVRECRKCKNLCLGEFVDDNLKDCINFIPKRISAEERFLRETFGTK